MSWKSIACIAALGALTAPALAVPSISVVDNGNGTGSLNVITTASGSIGAELTLVLSGATLTGATVNSAVFDTANPGDNPFIAGSPIGGDTTGLSAIFGGTSIFASYGSGVQPAGTYKLLDFTYTGTGTATGDGFVGFDEVLTDVAAVVTPIGNTPTPLPGDANGDGTVNLLDLSILGANFGQSPRTFAQGNFNEPIDTVVNLLDLSILGANFGATAPASAVAIPEPTSLAVLGLGLVTLAARRRV